MTPSPPQNPTVAVTAISCSGLTKRYGSFEAVSDVALAAKSGEVLGLVGENGAGKSTLLGMMSGAIAPSAGVLLVAGKTLKRLTPREAHAHGIASVPQVPHLVPHLSVAENIALGSEPSRYGMYDRAEVRRLAADRLDRLGMQINPSTIVASLSPPTRQMVQIITSMGDDPRIVFLDEPTAALGPKETEALFSAIAKLRFEGRCVIYVTHRMEEVFEITDSLAVLRDGHLVHHGPTAAVTRGELISLMAGRTVDERGTSTSGVSSSGGEPVLTAQGISLQGTLESANIDVHAGEVHAVAGMVGSGRTELLSVLAGANRPVEGQMTLNGRPYAPRSPRSAIRQGVVMVPEDRLTEAAFYELTLATNTVIGRQALFSKRGFTNRRSETRSATPFLERMDVKPLRPANLLKTLSGGNQQKVILARALASPSQVLLLDEPTQGVDVGTKAKIHQLMRSLADEGAAVVMASSDLEEVVAVADRVTVMSRGAVVDVMTDDITREGIIAAATTGTAVDENPPDNPPTTQGDADDGH